MMSRRQSPNRRRMVYFLDLLTKDTYNKEIKLFGLGDFFIERWNEIANRFYKENRGLVMRRYLSGFARPARRTRVMASAAAVASSSIEAPATGRPVRSATIVWKFSGASSRPWLISGW